MTNLRLQIAAAFAWLLVFYNIERFHEPINIASFVYVYAALLAMVVVALPHRESDKTVSVFGMAIAGLLALKWLLGYPLGGGSLPLTVTEICALGITLATAMVIGRSLAQFESTAVQVVSLDSQNAIPSFVETQSEFWRELRRARQFERPLGLLTIQADGESSSLELNRYLKELQQKSIQNYLSTRVGQVLASETKDCDMIALEENYFVLLLPEASGKRVSHIAARVERAVREKVGVPVRIGTALFPMEEVTLSGLRDRALSQMRGQPAVPLNADGRQQVQLDLHGVSDPTVELETP